MVERELRCEEMLKSHWTWASPWSPKTLGIRLLPCSSHGPARGSDGVSPQHFEGRKGFIDEKGLGTTELCSSSKSFKTFFSIKESKRVILSGMR